MKYHAVCFDLFNTLVNVGQVPLSVGRLTADILGIDSEQWNAACFGPHHNICETTDGYETLRRLAHSVDPAIPTARIAEAVVERQRRFDHALCHPEPGVVEALRQLREHGLRLALISNASTAEVQAWPRSPLAALFEISVFSCECGAQKPHPPIYQHALQRLQLPAERCVFVGDGGSDEHCGAAALGMDTVLLTTHLKPARHSRIQASQGHAIGCEVASLEKLVELMAGPEAG
jgi:putative hydrolase of the HAD superfamily